jgi:1-acyl-sn-glycerol-3-phosphate acyltransferase
VPTAYYHPPAAAAWRTRLAWRLLARAGWRIVFPPRVPARCVIVFYPHTSNWDFVVGLLVIWALALDVHWAGKDTLFRWPLGAMFRAWGGIAVNRRERTGLTARLAEEFARTDVLRLAIAPEGTRRRTTAWKSGFYHVAMAARVPILLAFIDYPRHEVGIGAEIAPTGDAESDIARMAAFYAGKTGRHPERQGPVRLEPADPS